MKFYKNLKTGEVIYSISDINDEDYSYLVANTTNGAFEKHVPVYSINDGKLFVRVGEVEHPMSEEHYIMWIAYVNGENIKKIDLKPSDKAEALFDYESSGTIYAYCNLHGLWKIDIDN